MKKNKQLLDDSTLRADAAKKALKQLGPEEQQRTQASDAKLPELVAACAKAKEDCEASLQRFEASKKRPKLRQGELGGDSAKARASSRGSQRKEKTPLFKDNFAKSTFLAECGNLRLTLLARGAKGAAPAAASRVGLALAALLTTSAVKLQGRTW